MNQYSITDVIEKLKTMEMKLNDMNIKVTKMYNEYEKNRIINEYLQHIIFDYPVTDVPPHNENPIIIDFLDNMTETYYGSGKYVRIYNGYKVAKTINEYGVSLIECCYDT